MSYNYESWKATVTVGDFTTVRDRVLAAFADTGAITIGRAIDGLTGDSFTMLAAVDMLIERGEARKVEVPGVYSQYWVLVNPREEE